MRARFSEALYRPMKAGRIFEVPAHHSERLRFQHITLNARDYVIRTLSKIMAGLLCHGSQRHFIVL